MVLQHAALAKEPLIGVISPYKAQVKSIKTKLQEAMPSASERIDVNTIDGFQGREKDVIIFSTVRTFAAKKNKKIGFVADERRVNVGLTRARCSLIVVGQRFVLQRDDNWEALLQFVSERGYVPRSLHMLCVRRSRTERWTPAAACLTNSRPAIIATAMRGVTPLGHCSAMHGAPPLAPRLVASAQLRCSVSAAQLRRILQLPRPFDRKHTMYRAAVRVIARRAPLYPETASASVCRTLYDAKPKFESFMASVLSGKAPPATFTPKPKEPTVFIPSAGDDNELVSRKRTAAGPQRRDKRQRR